jgi:hypothetical protein
MRAGQGPTRAILEAGRDSHSRKFDLIDAPAARRVLPHWVPIQKIVIGVTAPITILRSE